MFSVKNQMEKFSKQWNTFKSILLFWIYRNLLGISLPHLTFFCHTFRWNTCCLDGKWNGTVLSAETSFEMERSRPLPLCLLPENSHRFFRTNGKRSSFGLKCAWRASLLWRNLNWVSTRYLSVINKEVWFQAT